MSCFTGSRTGLGTVSRVIANAALNLGGSHVLWHIAIPCPYVRPDGNPCYSKVYGDSYSECPVCGGSGAIYDSPKLIRAIYSDNSNKFIPDDSGGFMMGSKSLSVPFDVYASILKDRVYSEARRVMRDKFTLLSPEGRPVEVLYLQDDPSNPTINSQTIYKIINVSNNR